MNNNDYIQKHSDILSFRELADGTIATYVSYLRIFLDWLLLNLMENLSLMSLGKRSVLSAYISKT